MFGFHFCGSEIFSLECLLASIPAQIRSEKPCLSLCPEKHRYIDIQMVEDPSSSSSFLVQLWLETQRDPDEIIKSHRVNFIWTKCGLSRHAKHRVGVRDICLCVCVYVFIWVCMWVLCLHSACVNGLKLWNIQVRWDHGYLSLKHTLKSWGWLMLDVCLFIISW